MTNHKSKASNAQNKAPGKAPAVRADHVLIVDDEAGYRDMLCWRLREEGMNVRVARDGEEALTLVEDGRVGIVVTDLTMPGFDGLTLLEKLKKTMPQTVIIVVSGFATVEASVSAMKGGAEDFILKPFDLEKFVNRIRRLLEAVSDPQP